MSNNKQILKRTKEITVSYPPGTVGVQATNITLDRDMDECIGVGFDEEVGAAQNYQIGLKYVASGASVLDLTSKRFLLLANAQKPTDRFNDLGYMEAKDKVVCVLVNFKVASTITTTVNVAFLLQKTNLI